jgi:hypothetical protein
MNLVWSPAFSRAVKRLLRQSPQMAKPINKTLEQLSMDIYILVSKLTNLKAISMALGRVLLTIVIGSYSSLYRL